MPKFTYSKAVIKRFMNTNDLKTFDDLYIKSKKSKKGQTLSGTRYRVTKEDIKYFGLLGKKMTIQEIANEQKVQKNTVLFRMGKVALRKLKKI